MWWDICMPLTPASALLSTFASAYLFWVVPREDVYWDWSWRVYNKTIFSQISRFFLELHQSLLKLFDCSGANRSSRVITLKWYVFCRFALKLSVLRKYFFYFFVDQWIVLFFSPARPEWVTSCRCSDSLAMAGLSTVAKWQSGMIRVSDNGGPGLQVKSPKI